MIGGAIVTLGGLNLADGLTGGLVGGTEANLPAAPDVVDSQAVREGVAPTTLCPK